MWTDQFPLRNSTTLASWVHAQVKTLLRSSSRRQQEAERRDVCS